jgi:hypothetical protein
VIIGFTVILNITGVPEQEFEMGITVNRPVMGILLILADTNEIGVPKPDALHPMPTLSFDQLKLVFATVEPINAILLATPAQTILSVIGLILGVGFTTILKVRVVPEQPLLKGVTVSNAEIGTLKTLVVVKLLIVPDPDKAANPMVVLLFVQLYWVPPTKEPVKEIALLATPEQNNNDETGFTTGVGFTIMLNAMGVPAQLFEKGVTNRLAVRGIPEKLVVVNAPIEPEPDNPSPIKELSFVH